MTKLKIALSTIRLLGILCGVVAIIILINLFTLPLKEELAYQLGSINKETKKTLTPPDQEFSILVEKINATSRIIKDVDPNNSAIYQNALADGVAHAKGSALPGESNNIFLFAHSSTDLNDAVRFNSVFYLLHHLEIGDIVSIWYLGQRYNYSVESKQIVSPNDVSYLNQDSKEEKLTLMTCWPPGTTYKRLLITAKRTI